MVCMRRRLHEVDLGEERVNVDDVRSNADVPDIQSDVGEGG